MIRFDNSWMRDLPGTFLRLDPEPAPEPRLLAWNTDLAVALNLDPGVQNKAAEWFSGAALPPGAEPVALAYAGHQFGGFSAQLGDGRAHLLGEVLDAQGQRFDIQLKGSGRTPFSRGGDGKAAVGPMLREYLISEAMAANGLSDVAALMRDGKDMQVFTNSAVRMFAADSAERLWHYPTTYVLSGTAANGLALSTMTPRYGALFCNAEAHIAVDECNSPEMFTGGAKILGLNGPGGKITPAMVEKTLKGFIRGYLAGLEWTLDPANRAEATDILLANMPEIKPPVATKLRR